MCDDEEARVAAGDLPEKHMGKEHGKRCPEELAAAAAAAAARQRRLRCVSRCQSQRGDETLREGVRGSVAYGGSMGSFPRGGCTDQ